MGQFDLLQRPPTLAYGDLHFKRNLIANGLGERFQHCATDTHGYLYDWEVFTDLEQNRVEDREEWVGPQVVLQQPALDLNQCCERQVRSQRLDWRIHCLPQNLVLVLRCDEIEATRPAKGRRDGPVILQGVLLYLVNPLSRPGESAVPSADSPGCIVQG